MTDYNFIDEQPEQSPELPLPHRLLIDAGKKLGVKSIATGSHSQILQGMAEEHAAYQAYLGKQGHQRWDERSEVLRKLMPECSEFKEVCAQSWDWNSMEEAAPEMYNSWRQSPGHWSAVNGRCDFWAYAMSFNGNQNLWYATGLFAILRSTNHKTGNK